MEVTAQRVQTFALFTGVAAVCVGFLAGRFVPERSDSAFADDPPFDWVIAFIAGGPLVVAAAVLLAASFVIAVLERR